MEFVVTLADGTSRIVSSLTDVSEPVTSIQWTTPTELSHQDIGIKLIPTVTLYINDTEQIIIPIGIITELDKDTELGEIEEDPIKAVTLNFNNVKRLTKDNNYYNVVP